MIVKSPFGYKTFAYSFEFKPHSKKMTLPLLWTSIRSMALAAVAYSMVSTPSFCGGAMHMHVDARAAVQRPEAQLDASGAQGSLITAIGGIASPR